MMPAHRGKSFEELRLEDYQRETDPDDPFIAATKRHWRVAAMNGDALAAANAAFAAVAAERDRLAVERDGLAAAASGRLAFRAPSPVADLRVSRDKPFVFGADVAEERVVTPETHSDKPFAFGASASGQEDAVTPDKKPFVFGATAAEPRVVTPETHSDKPFAFGANASGQEEPFVFGAKVDK